jgi:hypothetical protein
LFQSTLSGTKRARCNLVANYPFEGHDRRSGKEKIGE